MICDFIGLKEDKTEGTQQAEQTPAQADNSLLYLFVLFHCHAGCPGGIAAFLLITLLYNYAKKTPQTIGLKGFIFNLLNHLIISGPLRGTNDLCRKIFDTGSSRNAVGLSCTPFPHLMAATRNVLLLKKRKKKI